MYPVSLSTMPAFSARKPLTRAPRLQRPQFGARHDAQARGLNGMLTLGLIVTALIAAAAVFWPKADAAKDSVTNPLIEALSGNRDNAGKK